MVTTSDSFSLFPLTDLSDKEDPTTLPGQDPRVPSSLLSGTWGQVASGGDSSLEAGAAGELSHQAMYIRKHLPQSSTWDLCIVQE